MMHNTIESSDCLASARAVVDLLSDPATYPDHPATVRVIATHVSFVFIAGERVYKIKKPVRLDMMDFTTLEARRRNCERELALNRRLAPDVYLALVPIMRRATGELALTGEGTPVEWAVVMRRLDEDRLLDHMLARGQTQPADIERLCEVLAVFYAGAARVDMSPARWIAHWRSRLDRVEKSLGDPLFRLPAEAVSPPIRSLHAFIDHHSALLAERMAQGHIREGHGDLRPEHIYLGEQIRVIDCLEFDPALCWLDPFDEAAFLGMECERLGERWISPQLVTGLSQRLADHPPPQLLRFYRCYRACLRASLSIEHLRDATPRTPEKWPQQAREYLAIAMASLP